MNWSKRTRSLDSQPHWYGDSPHKCSCHLCLCVTIESFIAISNQRYCRLIVPPPLIVSIWTPQNVLLKHPIKSAIKVIDFGSSCFEHEKSKHCNHVLASRDDLWPSLSLYLHSESLLQVSWSHSRDELSHGNRYVEFGLHLSGASYWLSYLSWREWAGTTILHNGSTWCSWQGLCEP